MRVPLDIPVDPLVPNDEGGATLTIGTVVADGTHHALVLLAPPARIRLAPARPQRMA